MIIKNKKIAIVGGGPGGLTLARLLQMKGANVTVYERDLNRDVRVQGATLDLHEESGLKALQKAGLMDAFKQNYRPHADKIRIVDQSGKIVYDDHAQQTDADFGSEHFRPEIDRGPLRNILLDSLKPGTVVWNSHIVSLVRHEHAWTIEFQNGTTASADIVIGADGSNSRIRPFVTPVKAFYSGIMVVEGTIYNSEKNAPTIHQLLKGGKIFAMGDSKTLIVSSKGDGSMSFYTGFKAKESWARDSGIDFKNKGHVVNWFKQEYSAFDTLWHELFDHDETYFIPRPQYCMPLDQTWEANSDITLVGDAAHVMPPYAGEGVNMAMLDALELSECLTSENFTDVKAAIYHYETQMRKRASETAQITLEQTDSLHSPDAIVNMLKMFEQL